MPFEVKKMRSDAIAIGWPTWRTPPRSLPRLHFLTHQRFRWDLTYLPSADSFEAGSWRCCTWPCIEWQFWIFQGHQGLSLALLAWESALWLSWKGLWRAPMSLRLLRAWHFWFDWAHWGRLWDNLPSRCLMVLFRQLLRLTDSGCLRRCRLNRHPDRFTHFKPRSK